FINTAATFSLYSLFPTSFGTCGSEGGPMSLPQIDHCNNASEHGGSANFHIYAYCVKTPPSIDGPNVENLKNTNQTALKCQAKFFTGTRDPFKLTTAGKLPDNDGLTTTYHTHDWASAI